MNGVFTFGWFGKKAAPGFDFLSAKLVLDGTSGRVDPDSALHDRSMGCGGPKNGKEKKGGENLHTYKVKLSREFGKPAEDYTLALGDASQMHDRGVALVANSHFHRSILFLAISIPREDLFFEPLKEVRKKKIKPFGDLEFIGSKIRAVSLRYPFAFERSVGVEFSRKLLPFVSTAL